MFDIVIAYRCYPKVSKKPFKRADDKLAMICGGLQSMVVCLGSLKAKFYIIDDGCPDIRKSDIIKSLGNNKYEYIKTDHIGNFGTFAKQIEILYTQTESDIVYFAEDDYVYADKGFSEGIQLLKEKKTDFITLFDHRGHYTAYHHKIKHSYIIDDNNQRIWKSIASTCMTFLTTKQTLLETQEYLLKYSSGVRDYPLWLGLTKQNLTRIINIDRRYIDKIGIPATWLHTIMLWIKCWKQVVFGKKYQLYCPVPSICTHLETEDRAPLIDREKYAKN